MKSIKSCSLCGEALLTQSWSTFKTGHICCSCFNNTVRHHFHVGAATLAITQVPEFFKNLNVVDKFKHVFQPLMRSINEDTLSYCLCDLIIKYSTDLTLKPDWSAIGKSATALFNIFIKYAENNRFAMDELFQAINIFHITREILHHAHMSDVTSKMWIDDVRAIIRDVITVHWLKHSYGLTYHDLATTKSLMCSYVGYIERRDAIIQNISCTHRTYRLQSVLCNIWWKANSMYDIVDMVTTYNRNYNVVLTDHDIEWEYDEEVKYFIERKGE